MCLARTLLAAWYSHKMVFPISLHFGVRIAANGALKGHSWVSLPSATIWWDEAFREISQWHSNGSSCTAGSFANTAEPEP